LSQYGLDDLIEAGVRDNTILIGMQLAKKRFETYGTYNQRTLLGESLLKVDIAKKII
jgi:hypothetical protein